MTLQRRIFLQNTLVGAAALAGVSLFPRALMAAWPENAKKAFAAASVDEAMLALLNNSVTTESADIVIKAPDIAENGAVVPVQVTTTLAQVQSIVLLADKNNIPLVASFEFPEPATGGYISTRIKMATTSNIIAVVNAGGKLYSSKKEVKVTVGGCGG